MLPATPRNKQAKQNGGPPRLRFQEKEKAYWNWLADAKQATASG